MIMNFKDAYKSYNDEIKGNPDVLDAILNGKPKQKQVVSFRPVMAYAAMTALVVSLSFFGFNKFYGDPKPTKNYIASNNIRLTDIAKTQVEDSGIEEASIDTEDNVKQAPMQENQTSHKGTANGRNVTGGSVGSAKAPTDMPENVSGKNTVTGANEPYTADISLPDETVAEPSEGMQAATPPPVNVPESMPSAGASFYVPDAVDVPMAEQEALPVQESADLSAAVSESEALLESEALSELSPMMAKSGSGAAAYSPETDGEVQTYSGTESVQMPSDEYFEYLGIDIISRAKLPEDMTFETPGDATVEYDDGVVVSDMFTLEAYSAQNPQRSISLSVSKTGSDAGHFTDEISYDYTDDDTVVGAYTAAGDVSLSLGVQNVTKEEINNLMKSLKTEE